MLYTRVLSLFALAAAVGCGHPPGKTPPPTGRTSFAFEPIDVTGVVPLWGSASVGPFVVGGVDKTMAVQPGVFSLDGSDGTITATALPDLTTPRYCNCALFDDTRKELLVVGGRDANFNDATSAEIIKTDSGQHVSIDANGAADHPVGCHAFFSKVADKGWIFGGLSSTGAGFSGDTYRYDPSNHTLTKLDITGPPARYDAGIHQLDGGDVLLVGGMGGTAFATTFYSDIWRFSATNETWSEVPTTTATADLPQGRRYPWTSLAPDESMLLYGFGSDSGIGSHMLGDLWVFHFDSGEWVHQAVDGDLPKARGFTYKWQGPPNTAGVLAFGSDATQNVFTDAYVMQVPDSMAGNWH